MSRRWAAIAASVLLSLAAPAVAGAADERAAAQRFADAVLRGKIAIRAQTPEIERRSAAVDEGECARVLGDVPRRAQKRAVAIFTAGMFTAMFEPTLPALQRIVADLEAIPTADPALRSGRAAWRRIVEIFGLIPRVNEPCEVLVAWRDAGWTPEAAPPFDLAQWEKLLDEDIAPTVESKLRRAARRMRRLGVSRGAAERFRGETLYDDVEGSIGG